MRTAGIARGKLFPIAGQWQIQIVVRRQNVAEDAREDLTLTANPTRSQPGQTTSATPTETGFLWPRLLPNAYDGLLLALVGVALIALTALARFRASLPQRNLIAFRGWGIGALVAGMIVAGYFSADRTPTTDRANPLPNDAATLAIGQQVFAQNCALCHGAGGRGDGPMAANRNPRPVDLTAGHLTGHTDGDLYWWVSHGIPGTGMPAWSGTLSDQERWAVIRYLRSLRSAGP